MPPTNLRKAKTAAEGVSSIITVFIALELIGIGLLVTQLDSWTPAFFGIISILAILLFYYSWQSIYEILMHIGSSFEEEPDPAADQPNPAADQIESVSAEERVAGLEAAKRELEDTDYVENPPDNSSNTPVVPPSQRSSKRCIYSNITLGTRCNNWFDGEGQYCDEHSWVTNPKGN